MAGGGGASQLYLIDAERALSDPKIKTIPPQATIEQCLLIESSEEARRVIVGHAPRNVFQGYTLSGDTIKERGAYTGNVNNRPSKYFQVRLN